MSLSLDHLVISVTNLQNAMQAYSDAGFNVQYGGKHADGITENALILFADGTYLELLALTTGHFREEALFKGLLRAEGEGFTGYALQSDAIVDDLNTLDVRGIYISPIRMGSRARPDGVVLQWRMAELDNAMFPFVIQDDSPREWRVPAFGDAIVHENGALGIQALNIHCSNIEASSARYQAISGVAVEESASFCRVQLAGTSLYLYRNPQYEHERREDIVSLSLLKMTSIPQRLTVGDSVFILDKA